MPTATRRRKAEISQQDPSLPVVPIPPSEAKENEKSAYWLQLASDPDAFAEAIKTEDFFRLLRILPEALWGETLRLYLYRKEDDTGLMVKNPVGAKYNYKKVLFRPPSEEVQEWVMQNYGGGKYEFKLNWVQGKDSKTIKQHTFDLDGPPKVQPGEIVEINGKPVTIAAAPVAQPPAERPSETATVIEALSEANRQNMEMVTKGAGAAIEIVKAQAIQPVKTPESAQSSIMDKFLLAMIDKMMAPPPDPLATLKAAKELFASENPVTIETPDPPLEQAMGLVEKFTGKTFSQLLHGRSNNSAANPEDSGWSWLGPVIVRAIEAAPNLIAQTRIARAEEFSRQVALHNAKNGQPIPRELLAAPQVAVPAVPATTETAPNGAQSKPQPAAPALPDMNDPGQLMQTMVAMICHGFDTDPNMGYETAAAIQFNFGKQIELLHLDEFLTNETEVDTVIKGNPELAKRAAFPAWKEFKDGFMAYWGDHFGVGDEAEPEPPETLKEIPARVHQPVA